MVSTTAHPRSAIAAAWRFLVVGGSNTLVTTALLVTLSYFMEGWLAYTITFAAGIAYSTIFASRWVFTRAASRRATLLYAFCYVVIYLVGLGCVTVVRWFEWPQFLNALSIFVTAPLGFIAGRLVFRRNDEEFISD
ncbi:MAG: GtrA family protein [Rhodoglobus sp.]